VSTAEDQAAALREEHGERWQIWYVPRSFDGGYTWCATATDSPEPFSQAGAIVRDGLAD
jgi:hypothetical protein